MGFLWVFESLLFDTGDSNSYTIFDLCWRVCVVTQVELAGLLTEIALFPCSPFGLVILLAAPPFCLAILFEEEIRGLLNFYALPGNEGIFECKCFKLAVAFSTVSKDGLPPVFPMPFILFSVFINEKWLLLPLLSRLESSWLLWFWIAVVWLRLFNLVRECAVRLNTLLSKALPGLC